MNKDLNGVREQVMKKVCGKSISGSRNKGPGAEKTFKAKKGGGEKDAEKENFILCI